MDKFIGRKTELSALKRLLALRSASLVVVNGRRRIGKSRLIAEFSKKMRFYRFTGLNPKEGDNAQRQQAHFAKQFSAQFDYPNMQLDDWDDWFSLLAKETREGQVVILFDEISWMATGSDTFLGKLKIAWDDEFKQNSKLILFLCGSVSSWIEKNILSSKGYLGRPTLHITLEELPLLDCKEFWGNYNDKISSYEKLKFLSFTGGVPRYLELMNPAYSAEENIRVLAFVKEGALFKEFQYIFADIYGSRSHVYQKVIAVLENGSLTRKQISEKAKISDGGELTDYLNDLEVGGFIRKDFMWSIATKRISKIFHYRLKDNYTRFYLRYILPMQARIAKGYYEDNSLSIVPAWDSILGLQFENVVLNNYKLILKCLNIRMEDVVFENPFSQRSTKRQSGLQIDYMIQTRFNSVYICEIRFHRDEIGMDVIADLQQKDERLQLPKGYSRRMVLIHVNGVKEDVVESQYFSNIVSFGDLLE